MSISPVTGFWVRTSNITASTSYRSRHRSVGSCSAAASATRSCSRAAPIAWSRSNASSRPPNSPTVRVPDARGVAHASDAPSQGDSLHRVLHRMRARKFPASFFLGARVVHAMFRHESFSARRGEVLGAGRVLLIARRKRARFAVGGGNNDVWPQREGDLCVVRPVGSEREFPPPISTVRLPGTRGSPTTVPFRGLMPLQIRAQGLPLLIDDGLRGVLALGQLEVEDASLAVLPPEFDGECERVAARLLNHYAGKQPADIPGVAETRALFHRLD